MAFAFAYGTVSGGHFNPSVTVAVLAAGGMRIGEAAGYVVSQLAGGILGALLLRAVLGGAGTSLGTPDLAHNLGLGATTLTVTPWAGYVIEAVLGFFLSTVVLSTAVAGRAGNLAPLAIGVTLVFNIIGYRASEVPIYRIEKDPRLARKQGAYSVISAGGHILRRGHELDRVLLAIDRKLAVV